MCHKPSRSKSWQLDEKQLKENIRSECSGKGGDEEAIAGDRFGILT